MLWPGSAEFRANLDDFVYKPLRQKSLFHELTHPIYRQAAVFARPGMDTLDALQAYYDYRQITAVKVVEVDFSDSIKGAKDLLEAITSRQYESIIVNHADVLLLEPGDEAVTKFMLRLSDQLQVYECHVVCIFDRLIKSDDTYATAFAKEYRRRVLQQFRDAFLFYSAPDSTFNAKYFQFLVGTFCTHMQGKYDDAITPDEYTQLADASRYCTLQEIRDFMSPIFRELNDSSPPSGGDESPLSLSFSLIEKRLVMGGKSITRFDRSAEENAYSVFAGKGPIAMNKAIIKKLDMDHEDKKMKKKTKKQKTEDHEELNIE
jgi:hypothetical protein